MKDNGLEGFFVGKVVKGENNSTVLENASIEESTWRYWTTCLCNLFNRKESLFVE